jgi:hypothetical protein
MDVHKNARTTPYSRALIAQRVQRGEPVAAVARAVGVCERRHSTVVSPISGLNHRATTEYGRKYGRPNHSGISRRDLGAPKF